MNLDTLTSKLSPIKIIVSKHAVIIFVLSTVTIFGYMTFTISKLANLDPTDTQIDERKASLKQIKLNDNAIEKIESLEDQNINIESLFNNGRANPFE
jgi:Tfp pilus assembly protein PilO